MSWLIQFLLVGSAFSVNFGDAGVLSTGLVGQVGQYYHQRVGIPMAESIRLAELASNNNTNRITNGSRSPLGAFPFVGGLLIKLESGQTSMCTCSLVSAIRAVTAAHCVWDGQDRGRTFTAVFGSLRIFHGGTRVTTNEALRHPDYSRQTLNNDIALLKLPTVTFSGQTSMCTCSLVSAIRAVTAAHCVWDGQDRGRTFTAVFGSLRIFHGGTRVTTNEALRHPDYSRQTLNNDIALLKLPTVTFSANVAPISLPWGALLQNDLAGWSAQAIGFGITKDGGHVTHNQHLNNVTLKVISNEACGRTFTNINLSKLCTSGADGRNICSGDSGGPLAVTHEGKHVLVGVSSWGSGNGCQSGHPGGFARVSTFVPWIQSNME